MDKDSEQRREDEEQVVVFELAGESYGVEIGAVREIVRLQRITALPQARDHVEGVINLRGRVIPVVNLAKRFGMGGASRGRDARIMVMEVGAQTVGMVVDGVSEVLRIARSAVEPPSEVVGEGESDHLRGIAKLGERLVLLLSLDKALAGAR